MTLYIIFFILTLIVGFLEMKYYLEFAARVATKQKEAGISNHTLNEAYQAFTKGNHLSQYILKKEDNSVKKLRRIRIILLLIFIMLIIFHPL